MNNQIIVKTLLAGIMTLSILAGCTKSSSYPAAADKTKADVVKELASGSTGSRAPAPQAQQANAEAAS